jgi:hypothetical protein
LFFFSSYISEGHCLEAECVSISSFKNVLNFYLFLFVEVYFDSLLLY